MAMSFKNMKFNSEPNQEKLYFLIKLIHSRQYKSAESEAEKLLKEYKNSFKILNLLGLSLINQSKNTEGIACFEKAIKIKPNFAEAYNNLGIAFKNSGKIKKSINCYQNAIKFKSNFAHAHNNLGLIMMDEGKIEDAKNHFKTAIKIDQNFAFAHRHLSIVTKYTEETSHVVQMKKNISNINISSDQKMHLAFGLGKAFDDIKKYDLAFKYFDLGNKLRRNQLKYNIKDDILFFENLKKNFNKSLLDEFVKFKKYNITPIFIVGMFRSGTTLVEQILASHPGVFGGGESKVLPQIVSHFLYKNSDNVKNKNTYEAIGKLYIDAAKKFQPNYKYITDKLPINFKWIAIIKIAIPNAKIIHCVRNPLDNCLSIYKNYFDFNINPYAYNLNELGKYYNCYKDLMRYWHSLMPNFIYDISYEKLIQNQKEETKKLLDFCDLDWNNKCMNFYKNKRNVSTASVMQVRKPIYKSSVNSWEKYRKHLSVLIDELN